MTQRPWEIMSAAGDLKNTPITGSANIAPFLGSYRPISLVIRSIKPKQ